MLKFNRNKYVKSTKANNIQKIFLRFSLGLFVAILTVMLSNSGFISNASFAAAPSGQQTAFTSVAELVRAGKKSYQAGQFANAIELWRRASELLPQGDTINQAVILTNLASSYQQFGDWQQANAAISQSLKLLEKSTNQNILAGALSIQGSLQLSQGQAEQALSTWESATAIYKKLGDKALTARSLLNKSQAMRALGMYRRAKETLLEVSQNLQKEPDSQLKVSSLFNLGDTLRLMGDRKTATSTLQQTLELARKLNLKDDISLVLLSLGNNARAEQDIDAAQEYYKQVIAASNPNIKLQAQLNLLQLFVEAEQTDEGLTLAKEIQPQIEKLSNSPSRTSIYAQVNFVQSLKKLGRDAINRVSTAQILATAAHNAENIGDKRAQSYALGYLGELYEQTQQWSEAQKLTEKALNLALSSNAPDIAYRWQWQLGRLLKAQDNIQGSIASYNEAVKTLGNIRNDLVSSNVDVQFSFRETVEPVYRELVSLLLQPKLIASKTNKADVSQENLKKAREVIESLQLAELDNYFREACLTARPQQIDQIDKSAAVIYPIILKDRLEVVLSIPNQPLRHYAAVMPQAELEKIFDRMRRSLHRTSSQKDRLNIAQLVYNLLISPAEADLQRNNIKTLAFVLDGAMKNLPMAILYDGQEYLVEKYNLALTPGLQLFAPRRLESQQLKILAGGLSESRQGFVPLPGVESEIKQIKNEISAQVLLNKTFTTQAIEKQVNTSRYPVVHLATHGQFSSNADDTFVLTWDNRINVKQLGELLQNRASDSNNAIELLVLSACQTADGDKRAALGLAGVAVRSGARSTVATLWSVDDTSTSAFMVEFYKQLAKPNMTKAEALRNAQIALLKQPAFKHPFYWAPFVLIGNWL
ncbi:CHAT domain-containing protein [Dulcicalothrix desertica]|nr:CHAT domain-containing protein [Dulcicalothrix desertica]TWH39751.1 CHAT domain-containing protein [Dulcicalothrix desertica PCC 7102]